jgi:putative spermidine/putrescine transport system permease protein
LTSAIAGQQNPLSWPAAVGHGEEHAARMASEVAGRVSPASAETQRVRQRAAAGWLIWPALLLFVFFFLLPLGVLAVMAFLSGNPVNAPTVELTLRHFQRFFADELYLEALWATLRIGLLTTLATLLLGYPLAHLMARARSRVGHALLLMAVIAPMLTGIVVRTFAWMTLLQDKGVINTTLIALGLTAKPLKLMYNEFGTVVALTHIYVPFMVLTLAGVIGRVDERLEEAARSLGATRWQAFREVTLPLSLPGILAGSLLVFALAISAYVTPFLMGGTEVLTLPMLIYQQVSSSFNPNFAGALGVVLLAVSLAVVIAYNKVLAGLSGEGGLS